MYSELRCAGLHIYNHAHFIKSKGSSMWQKEVAVQYLNEHGGADSLGRCGEYVRKAIEAGGTQLNRHRRAKDYGASLLTSGFVEIENTITRAGDVAVIQPIPGHPSGHMAMFNGTIWVSDFRQLHGYYPGPGYRQLRPPVKFYRRTH
ncbi:CHAP domain-containing protein [Massilia genomosp. 1]|nr:CHAP domain-containing protein [Massilia genomosp. 1]